MVRPIRALRVLCVALQAVYDGEGWVSVGFSDTGEMVVGDAVIGLPDDATTLEYSLESRVSYGNTDVDVLSVGRVGGGGVDSVGGGVGGDGVGVAPVGVAPSGGGVDAVAAVVGVAADGSVVVVIVVVVVVVVAAAVGSDSGVAVGCSCCCCCWYCWCFGCCW